MLLSLPIDSVETCGTLLVVIDHTHLVGTVTTSGLLRLAPIRRVAVKVISAFPLCAELCHLLALLRLRVLDARVTLEDTVKGLFEGLLRRLASLQ